MKNILLFLLVFFSITFSQIPEFDTKEEFAVVDSYTTICFVDWDNDNLVDIITVPGATRLRFFKNVGSLTSPSYENQGYLKNEKGNSIYIEHG